MSEPNNQNPNRQYLTVGIALKNIHDEVLLIQEAEGGKWRLPYEHLYEGDNFPSDPQGAASVIGTKLTGYDFDMHGICYLNLCEDSHGKPSVVIIYAADQPHDVSLTDSPDPEKVAARGWVTYDNLLRLNEEGLLRDPELTLAAAKNVQQGLTVPPELIAI